MGAGRGYADIGMLCDTFVHYLLLARTWESESMMTPTRTVRVLVLAGLASVIACHDAARDDEAGSRTNGPTYEFANGNWFNGESFESRTWYSVNGILSSQLPEAVDSVFDLGGGYILPPFGDAHCHLFDDSSSIASIVDKFLKEGVIYAADLNNSIAGRQAVADKVNIATSVDVAYANGAPTATMGHPMLLYESLALGLYNPDAQRQNVGRLRASRLRENDAYFIIDTEQDLDAKWPTILRGEPNLIKIALVNSEAFEESRQDESQILAYGLDPELARDVVERAHSEGLRVFAHVDTAFDFTVAVRAGVDVIAHLPGIAVRDLERSGEAAYTILHHDAQLAAERGIVVTTTVSFMPPDRALSAIQRQNLRTLKKYGVPIAIGSDANTFSFQSGAGPATEVMRLHELDVFSNLELLKMWVEITPQVIFPERRVGSLQDGYEASFVVLRDNPLEDFAHITGVAMLWKQGQRLLDRQ